MFSGGDNLTFSGVLDFPTGFRRSAPGKKVLPIFRRDSRTVLQTDRPFPVDLNRCTPAFLGPQPGNSPHYPRYVKHLMSHLEIYLSRSRVRFLSGPAFLVSANHFLTLSLTIPSPSQRVTFPVSCSGPESALSILRRWTIQTRKAAFPANFVAVFTKVDILRAPAIGLFSPR